MGHETCHWRRQTSARHEIGSARHHRRQQHPRSMRSATTVVHFTPLTVAPASVLPSCDPVVIGKGAATPWPVCIKRNSLCQTASSTLKNGNTARPHHFDRHIDFLYFLPNRIPRVFRRHLTNHLSSWYRRANCDTFTSYFVFCSE